MQNPMPIFFADRPGLNRVHGRADLVYDPWLYPVFESTAWPSRDRNGSPTRSRMARAGDRRRRFRKIESKAFRRLA